MFLLILFQKSPHVNQLSAIQVKGPCPDVWQVPVFPFYASHQWTSWFHRMCREKSFQVIQTILHGSHILVYCPEDDLGMDQYLLIPFLVGWTSICQLFWCSPGVQGFDTLPFLFSLSLSLDGWKTMKGTQGASRRVFSSQSTSLPCAEDDQGDQQHT